MSWKKILPNFVSKFWAKWAKKVEDALVVFTPAYVSKNNNFFSPLVALIALITSVFLIGTIIGSFFTLLSSLLVLYFILTRVFGIRLDLGDVFVVS